MLSLWGIGLVTTLCITYWVGRWIYSTFFKPINLSQYRKQQSWAVITGATDGIGLGFAQVLSEHGFNILLVSRNKEKLESVKRSIQDKAPAGIQVDYVVSNASDSSQSNIQGVVEKVKSRNVTILVNNVGVLKGYIKPLHELEVEDIEESVKVNCIYPTLLTKALIPVMLRSNGRKLIINLSSTAGLGVTPLLPVYAATKGYNRIMSLSLSADYAKDDFDVLCVTPGLVESNMSKVKPFILCCRVRECVEATLSRVDQVDIIPHWKHVLAYSISYWTSILPNTYGLKLSRNAMLKFASSMMSDHNE